MTNQKKLVLKIGLDKVDGFIRVYDGLKYLVLFDSGERDAISSRIRYLISRKVALHMFFIIIMKNLYDSLPLEKTLIFHNVIILINPSS